MEVKVASILKNTNMIRSSGRDWEEFIKKVLEMRAQVPAEEKIVFDAKGIFIEYSNKANDIVNINNIKLVVYNAEDFCTTINTVCILCGKPRIAENIVVEKKSLTTKPLTDKEKNQIALVKEYEENMKVNRPFMGIFRVELESWKSTNSANFYGTAKRDALIEAMMKQVKSFEEANVPINKIIFSAYRVEIASMILEAIADKAGALSEKGITLEMRCDDDEEERKLKLRTNIKFKEMDIPRKVELLKKLGRGRVGLLTKVKKRRSNNIELRLDDQLVKQYIAILNGIAKDGKVVFNCFSFVDLVPTCDEYVESGEEPCEEDIAEGTQVEVSIADLGICDVCLGIVWHFETFDGKAKGIQKKYTYAGPDGCYSGVKTEVNVAEYIRRSLLSMEVPFNNEALIKDSAKFEMDMNLAK